jgi:hypothetical protein
MPRFRTRFARPVAAALLVTAVAVTATVASATVAFAERAVATVSATTAWWHDLTGNWTFSVVTDNGTGTPAVTLKQVGERLTGTYESRMMGVRAFNGTVKGDSVTLTLDPNGPDGVALVFKGVVVSADSLRGLVDFGGMGGATFTGVRVR